MSQAANNSLLIHFQKVSSTSFSVILHFSNFIDFFIAIQGNRKKHLYICLSYSRGVMKYKISTKV